MIFLPVAAAVALLVILVAVVRVQPFLALVVTALVAALMLGVPLSKIPDTIQHGLGDTLGSLAIIICLGAMFGKLVADSGAASRIADTLVTACGARHLPLALAATGLIAGVPLFYNVGFVVMVPLIFSVAYTTRHSAVYLGVPLLAGLSIAHGFLPPHPSPSALVQMFGASVGLTLGYGLLVAIPTLLIAGPLFATTLKHLPARPSPLFENPQADVARPMPGAFASFACALLPIVMIGAATLLAALPLAPTARAIIAFLGTPSIVLLATLAVGTQVLGMAQGRPLGAIMRSYDVALRDVAGVLLMVGGAGALKQVFVDSGIDRAMGMALAHSPMPPLVLGWLLAAAIRVALGSATVAGLTAASIVRPTLATTGCDPNLMVLAIGAGSLMFSHVNDSGFWLFKEYFGLDLKQTFRSWSLMETIVGISGLVFTVLLSLVI